MWALRSLRAIKLRDGCNSRACLSARLIPFTFRFEALTQRRKGWEKHEGFFLTMRCELCVLAALRGYSTFPMGKRAPLIPFRLKKKYKQTVLTTNEH